MEEYWSARHTLGFDHFPGVRGNGTIPSEDARHDDMNDLIGARLRRLWKAQQHAEGWTAELEHARQDLERICTMHGYTNIWVDPRNYLVHRVGQSLLYDVPIDKRGGLAPFAGKRVRVVCLRSGSAAQKRNVWSGVIGDAPTRSNQSARKPLERPEPKPRLPRLLGEKELAATPHLLVRFAGVWNGAGGMARAFNRGLRYQAAVWYGRRFRNWTGVWPQGRHDFIIAFGPTDEFAIRSPIGTAQGYREIVLHFEVHEAGGAFERGNEEVGFNWCAFALADLEGR